MSVLTYSSFLLENHKPDIEATHLINQEGIVKKASGVISHTKGIFDDAGRRYVAAIGRDGRLYSTLPDINTIVTYIDKGLPPAPDHDVPPTTVAGVNGIVVTV